MYCNNCGYQMPDGSDYCDSCGNKMFQPPSKEEAAVAAAEIAAASAQAQPNYSNPFAAPQAQPYGSPYAPPQPQQPAYFGSAPQPSYGQQPYYGNSAQPMGMGPPQGPTMSPYGYPTFQPDYAHSKRTNTFALVGFILSFFAPLVGIVLSIIGLSDSKKKNEGGQGLAVAGIIISIVRLLLGILVIFISVLEEM